MSQSKKLVSRDEFLTRFDAVMSELKTVREEQTVMAYQISGHYDRLEALEAKVQQLESR